MRGSFLIRKIFFLYRFEKVVATVFHHSITQIVFVSYWNLFYDLKQECQTYFQPYPDHECLRKAVVAEFIGEVHQ